MSKIINIAKDKIPSLGKIKQRVEIDILRLTDHKGFTVKVDKETATGFQTKAYGQDRYMIWKNGEGFSFPDYDKYFAIEGELLTSYVTEEGEKKTVTVPEFLKDVWPDGEAAYEAMRINAPELVEPLENKKYAATVTVKTPKIDSNAETVLSEVKAQEILKDASLEIANSAARAKEKTNKWTGAASDAIKYITGGAVLYFLEHALELF